MFKAELLFKPRWDRKLELPEKREELRLCAMRTDENDMVPRLMSVNLNNVQHSDDRGRRLDAIGNVGGQLTDIPRVC